MGWKGVVREIERSARRAEKQRQKQYKYEQKMEQIGNAQKEVSDFENYLESLKSFHLQDVDYIDWKKKLSEKKPSEPKKMNPHESHAKKALKSYSPSFLDKTFSRIEKKKKRLSDEIISAKKKDESEYKKTRNDFLKRYENWKKFNSISKGIMDGDLKYYIEAIKEIKPFEEKNLPCGSASVDIKDKKTAVLSVKIPNAEDIIPSETKSFLKSGKVSIKAMPKTKYNELFQDCVCSLSIALAKILLSTLPLEIVFVNISKNTLNSQTGHTEEKPILSVAISNKTLSKINLGNIDPSDCIKNFVHHIKFKKSSGFESVDPLDYSKF